MINAKGLLFSEGIADNTIEFTRRIEISAEGFFDNYACPASLAGLVQACGLQILEDRFELLRACCQVEQAVAARAVAFVDLIKTFGQLRVASFIPKFAAVIEDRLRERVPDFVAHRLARKF